MGFAFAQNPADEWFNQANAAYNSGNYETAVELYEKILATDMESVPVYYNMGNAYYKMREYPMAIYSYEKALKLDPSNEEVRTNLEIANLAISVEIDTYLLIEFTDIRIVQGFHLNGNVANLIVDNSSIAALHTEAVLNNVVIYYAKMNIIPHRSDAL